MTDLTPVPRTKPLSEIAPWLRETAVDESLMIEPAPIKDGSNSPGVESLLDRSDVPPNTVPAISAYSPGLHSGELVGHVQIIDKQSKQPVKADVQFESKKAGSIGRYTLNVDGREVGFTIIDKAQKDADIDRPYLDDHLCVHSMEAKENHTYKGIGSALHQIAVEVSFKEGSQGKLFLHAQKSSHTFHYKCGFRAQDPAKNDYAEDPVINGYLEKLSKLPEPPSTRSLGDALMVLTAEMANDVWSNKISSGRILSN